jgi:RimJ/RimL family protein N-acetyltransferase
VQTNDAWVLRFSLAQCPQAGHVREVFRGSTKLALRPDLTGRRIGLGFVEAGMDFARRTFAPATFRLDVATFNQRAIRVYERAGFTPGPRFIRYTRLGPYEFMEMTRAS